MIRRNLFCFTNKRKKQIKLLYWQRSGFCLWENYVASYYRVLAIAAARSTRRFHRLHCLRGTFDPGTSYR
jgi:hypothetical protein